MARNIRDSKLEHRTSRLKLPQRWKPYIAHVGPGVRLGYRRKKTAGSWSVIAADGAGGNWMKSFGTADDYQEANGADILDFWQAQARARLLAHGEDDKAVPVPTARRAGSEAPITVAEALEHYQADLRIRGGDELNVTRLTKHLSAAMRNRPVSLLNVAELKAWRNGLGKSVAASTVNRISNCLRAALNLCADTDERIRSRRSWEIGLQSIPGATRSRNVVLTTNEIQRVVAEAYAISQEFGLFIECAAVTGARTSQLAKLTPSDVQLGHEPRLMMPRSKKGRGPKRVGHTPVPILHSLAVRLRDVGRKSSNNLLLVRPNGKPWEPCSYTKLFRRAVGCAGLDPEKVTANALRHSSITRMICASVPIRIVAVLHNTSVSMIEKTYSSAIADHSDALARPTLLDLGTPAPSAKVRVLRP